MSGYTKGSGRVPTGFAAETFISESTFRQAHRAIEANPNVANAKKRKRESKGESGIVSGAGAYKGPWARYEEERPDAASDEEFGDDEEVEIIYEEDEIVANPAPAPKKLAGTDYHDTEAEGETSEFVGSQEYDYQGRTYMHVPNGMYYGPCLHDSPKLTMYRPRHQVIWRSRRREELHPQKACAHVQVPHKVYHPSALYS